jgi:hypothetical protein
MSASCVPRPGRVITTLGGLTAFLAATIGLASVASAAYLPPDPVGPSAVPTPQQATAAIGQLPLWVIAAMVAGTVLLSAATTLATLSLARLRERRLLAPDEAKVSVPIPASSPEHQPGQDDILLSHLRHDHRLGT